MTSIYNSQDEAYKTPFGAVAAGIPLHFTLRVPADFHCKTPYLFLRPDKGTPRQLPLEAAGQQEGRDVFCLTWPAEEPGLYFYWFDLYTDYRKLYAGPLGEAYLTTETGTPYQLTIYDASYAVPKEAPGSVMYQIFPDRFLEGNPGKPLGFNERIYRADKRKEPYFWPTDLPDGRLTLDYFGGDLLGIQKRLPYLRSLGVGWIYLNPIFEAHSNHRYNTADYMQVDPYLGTNEDFVQLCAKAGELGIRILLDGVFSHTGSDSLYFNKEGRYPTHGAWQGPGSPYRDWYCFNPDGSYESWWGFLTLPTCNKRSASFRQFICGEGGVIDHWLSLGASGFRLDVADELPDDFIAEIRGAVKRHGEDKLLIGEVWEDASHKEAYGVRRKYFLGEELDGVMNYPFRTAILFFLSSGDAAGFADAVMSICENYPAPALSACTTHLSTHDTERILTALADEPLNGRDRDWQSGRRLSQSRYEEGLQKVKLAFVLQFTLPGIPCIYYGDEIGMQGYKDPFNRAYYDWTSGETRLIELIIELSKLRRNCSAFRNGRLHFSYHEPGLIVYERRDEQSAAAVSINFSGRDRTVELLGKRVAVSQMGYAWHWENWEQT
ncbi:glycoside hydrolase family 13 protein [Ruminococcaceae bacterium OttesenSCG-928-I18]|nr:glycoside hydrolase family 13 protein [Ruminococcaceae bacterium OttesenSCG-928-I18]